jgi:hypothetical protein
MKRELMEVNFQRIADLRLTLNRPYIDEQKLVVSSNLRAARLCSLMQQFSYLMALPVQFELLALKRNESAAFIRSFAVNSLNSALYLFPVLHFDRHAFAIRQLYKRDINDGLFVLVGYDFPLLLSGLAQLLEAQLFTILRVRAWTFNISFKRFITLLSSARLSVRSALFVLSYLKRLVCLLISRLLSKLLFILNAYTKSIGSSS